MMMFTILAPEPLPASRYAAKAKMAAIVQPAATITYGFPLPGCQAVPPALIIEAKKRNTAPIESAPTTTARHENHNSAITGPTTIAVITIANKRSAMVLFTSAGRAAAPFNHKPPKRTMPLQFSKTFRFPRTPLIAALAAFLAIGASGCASLSLKGVTSAAAPDQPKSGPGGSDYRHADWVVDSGGTGVNAWYVFQPTRPRPASAPLAVMMHGYWRILGLRDARGVYPAHRA